MKQAGIDVSSEIGTLKKVMIHRPDAGIENILIKKLHDWLYDDIVDIEKMQSEYDHFISTLLLFLDPTVLFNSNDEFSLSELDPDPESDGYFGKKTDMILAHHSRKKEVVHHSVSFN